MKPATTLIDADKILNGRNMMTFQKIMEECGAIQTPLSTGE